MKKYFLIFLITIAGSLNFAQNKQLDSLAEGKRIIAKYVEALGGAERLNSVMDRTTVMKMESNGMQMKTIAYQKFPNKKRQEIYTGNVEQVILFDGVNGTQVLGENERPITGDELARLKTESVMNMLTNMDSLGIRPYYTGTDTLNGEDIAVVRLVFPTGNVWIQGFNLKTGLKVKEEKTLFTPAGNFQQVIYLSDYREVGGIMYPYKIKQSLNKQSISVTVTKIDVNKGLSDELFLTK